MASASPKPNGAVVVEDSSLVELLRERLDRRRTHVAEIVAIDAELARAFQVLADDVPADVWPARVVAPVPAPPPVPPTPPAKRMARAPQPAAPPEDRAPNDIPRGQSPAQDVLRAIQAGYRQPKTIWAVLSWPPEQIKHALRDLIAAGLLTKSGSTNAVRYTLATTPPTPPAKRPEPTRVTRVQDGVELEVVWAPGKDAPSLIGDREIKGSTL